MDGLGDQLLAGAAFAGDQHGGIGVGHAFHDAQDLLQQGAAADDVVEGEAVVERPAQLGVLAVQLSLLDHPVDLVPQLDVVERLLQVVQRALLDGLDRRLDGAEGGQEDDPDQRVVLFQLLEDLQSRAAGDHLVHDHHVHVGASGWSWPGDLFSEMRSSYSGSWNMRLKMSWMMLSSSTRWMIFFSHRLMLLSGLCSGKGDDEGGAAVDLAVHLDVAVMLLDDVVDDGQAQAGPLADRLGGEERIEYLFQVLFRDAAAVVLEADGDLLAALFAADRDPALALDGVDGVDEQVDEQLLQPGGEAVEAMAGNRFPCGT